MSSITKIGIIVRTVDDSVLDTFNEVNDWLILQKRHVLLEHSVGRIDASQRTVSADTIGRECEACIVIGGDGTFLAAARMLVDHRVPLIGINRGRLGFLVDVSTDNKFRQLGQILKGQYEAEQRFMLECDVMYKGEVVASYNALNDVVIRLAERLRVLDYTAHIDDRFVYRQRADGLIVSTPTGSTAYALSNGGPIIHPSQDALLLVSISPHTLAYRPLVVPRSSVINITLQDLGEEKAQLIADGQIYHDLKAGEEVVVRTQNQPITLLHPEDYDFFDILRAKLNWG